MDVGFRNFLKKFFDKIQNEILDTVITGLLKERYEK